MAQKLEEQIEKGRELQATPLQSSEDVRAARAAQTKWHDYSIEYLARAFDVPTLSQKHATVRGIGPMYINSSVGQLIEGFRTGIGQQITHLESILERLDLIDEVGQQQQFSGAMEKANVADSRSVFVVHGHDDAAKESVARFLERLDLDPVILHEQPNQGRTVIEKFEAHAYGVGFAVALLTPDDVGASATSPDEASPRARQNVILELGYFAGQLGRSRVCVLYREGVEIPSDYLGMLYVPLDDRGAWKLELAKELKSAGIEVDANKAM